MIPGSAAEHPDDPVDRRVSRYVAVGGDADRETRDDCATGRGEQQRRSLPRRLHEAALRAVLGSLPAWAAVILLSAVASTALLTPDARSLGWATAVTALAMGGTTLYPDGGRLALNYVM